MKTITDILTDYLSGRAKTRIYGIFTFWLSVLFIDVIFAALFVDQAIIFEKTHQLKSEYIREHFFTFTDWWALPIIIGAKLVIAAGLTYLTIWVLPKHLLARAYRREIEDEYNRKKDKIEKENELEQAKLKLVNKQLQTTKIEKKVVNQQEKLIEKEKDAWESEYETFKKNTIYSQFSDVQECLYKHAGQTYASNEYGDPVFELSSGLAAYIDANELATVSSGKLNLTEKGRYFMKKYLDEPAGVIPF